MRESQDGIQTGGAAVRRVRRTEDVRVPFIPYGLVPAAGLVLVMLLGLAPFAFGGVEAAAKRAADQALSDAGADWAQVDVSGQWVSLSGAAPSQDAADEAIAAVRDASADTLLGPARPVTRVNARFTWREADAPPGAISGDDDDRSPAPADATPQVQPSPAPETSQSPASREAAECDARMEALLNSALMEFNTGSAAILTRSAGLLDELAHAAKRCPGVLRISGHTDDTGGEETNIALSLRRAEAVRDALVRRGVPAERMIAEGFGASSPLADNASEEGRSRNRRIEIRVSGQ